MAWVVGELAHGAKFVLVCAVIAVLFIVLVRALGGQQPKIRVLDERAAFYEQVTFTCLFVYFRSALFAVASLTAANAAGRRVTASDVIQIHILNQPELDTQVRVAPDGI